LYFILLLAGIFLLLQINKNVPVSNELTEDANTGIFKTDMGFNDYSYIENFGEAFKQASINNEYGFKWNEGFYTTELKKEKN
tara:strand:+ start:439 stop:684 length:246 start_codon:yes stop_codon:yes gene_type:complete